MAKDYKLLLPDLDMSRLPRHVGIIMDGNGRWAKQHNRPRLYGHSAGAKSIRQVVELGVELKLEYLTFYAFSTENWNRPEDEVQGLLKLLRERLIKEIPELNEQNIYVQFIGSEINLDPEYLAEIRAVAAKTHQNTGMVVNIAFNYGGRLEIIEAIKKLKPEEILSLTPDNFGHYLWTKEQPDPDLIIRSSGEKRLSNFLLWQAAYSEIYVTEVMWPDFDKVEMIKALQEYQQRNRRYGGLGK
ncbi:MAG: polyprenyl diphosphate synthase [Candidatus Cloacimonetes bacterium]|jgi:undecaprenyl diphosphate synthase|nr:di-trans,poly-cis-decaprenylcistransferase [Candidatus Cloacimonadota bacterium]MDD2422989.1 polyprenyl diphosphate synthase [Candidatus Cloacimonadota bacterium]MDD3562923.1 polyprenyl diphosphate synthase [Candidatus Cloacimonadota bacterium]MDD4276316.1 polyprenyl diphosphate synthase [Candidatus Cloacimonadota bacterium]MDY0326210.1 polyprenyl diphosphate synthase [Candidatus Cloacimonadaceae bacterium]